MFWPGNMTTLREWNEKLRTTHSQHGRNEEMSVYVRKITGYTGYWFLPEITFI